VQRFVGYGRYDTEAAQKLMNELYVHLRLYSTSSSLSWSWCKKHE